MLALIDAKADVDEDGYGYAPVSIQATYDAAVAEYEAAHAPTADEIKDHLVEHIDTDVDVSFEGGVVTVMVGLEWIEDCEVAAKFGHCQDRDYDNQCLGECC